jgi:hypothetical protein
MSSEEKLLLVLIQGIGVGMMLGSGTQNHTDLVWKIGLALFAITTVVNWRY